MSLRSGLAGSSNADLSFYIFWTFLQIGKGFGLVASNTYFLALLVCGLPFALGKLLLTRWTSTDFMKFLVLNVVGIIAMVFSGETTYWLTIFCVTAAKGMDLKKVLKINLFVRGPMFVVRTALAMFGVLDVQKFYRFEGTTLTGIRYGLGYGYPNTTQVELFLIIVLLLYFYGKQMKWQHYGLVMLYNYLIFTYTDSRTTFLLAIVFIAGTWLINYGKSRKVQLLIRLWSDSSWIICMLLSALGCVLYFMSPDFRGMGTFASRFQTATATISQEVLPLFGTKGVYTDLGYVYILYSGGLVLAALFLIGINVLVGKLRKRNEKVLIWALSTLAVFAILEHSIFSVLTNGLLLLLRDVVYPYDTSNRKDDLLYQPQK